MKGALPHSLRGTPPAGVVPQGRSPLSTIVSMSEATQVMPGATKPEPSVVLWK